MGKDFHKKRNQFIWLIKWFPIIMIFAVSMATITTSAIGAKSYLAQKKKDEIAKTKKDLLRTANKAFNSIENFKRQAERFILESKRISIKQAVLLGVNIMDAVVKQHPGYTREMLLDAIRDRLREMRFFGTKNGYYFVYDSDGTNILLPIKPSVEGKNLWNYRDIQGKRIVHDLIKGSQQHPEGVYDQWHYYLPGTKIQDKKIGFAYYYKKLGIMIGTAYYYKDIHQELIRKFVNIVRQLNKLDYVTLDVVDTDLHSFYHTGAYKDNELRNFITKIKASKGDKSAMSHTVQTDDSIKKYRYDKKLDLILINKISLTKIHKITENIKKDQDLIFRNIFMSYFVVMLIFMLLSIVISIYTSGHIKKVFLDYEESLNHAREVADANERMKSEFLANMSHEIRTPLNAMFGFIGILKEQNLPTESLDHINIIEKSGKNLLTIINDILDFSKIESGKLDIELHPFDLREELGVLHALFDSQASQKNILLTSKETNIKYNIISDSTRLKQVISNLLSNAIKFTDRNKKVELNVSYNDVDEVLSVEIIDEGIGIAPDKLDTIFHPFEQADNSTTRKFGGTGLGLAISHQLIKLLGGELKVESTVGQGSRFYFDIPAQKGSPLTEQKVQKPKSDLKGKKFDNNILLVEDNETNQLFMKLIFKKLGVTLDIANNGQEAIEKYEQNDYDMIFMDENMPIMNGIEATIKIREIEKSQDRDRILIVALTANAIEGDKERFINAGMDKYLSKPLSTEKLLAIFEQFNAIAP